MGAGPAGSCRDAEASCCENVPPARVQSSEFSYESVGFRVWSLEHRASGQVVKIEGVEVRV